MPTPPALTRHRGLLGTDPTVVLEHARGQGWNEGPSGHCEAAWLGLVRGRAREENNGAHAEGEEVTWRAKHSGPRGHSRGPRSLSLWAAEMQEVCATDLLVSGKVTLRIHIRCPHWQAEFIYLFIHSFHYLIFTKYLQGCRHCPWLSI